MDLRKLKTLIDLVAESGISELEVAEGEGKIRIIESTPQVMAPMQYVPMPIQAALAVGVPVAAVPAAVGAEVIAPTLLAGHTVAPPMVGTFCRSPSPGVAELVRMGDTIGERQIIYIIETIELLDEIETDKAGVIKEILVENGQAVEYGQPLFVIG